MATSKSDLFRILTQDNGHTHTYTLFLDQYQRAHVSVCLRNKTELDPRVGVILGIVGIPFYLEAVRN